MTSLAGLISTSFMKKHRFFASSGISLLAAIIWSGCAKAPTPAANQDLISHGRYLVHDVAMCVDCHSPRDAKGEFIPGKDLTGTPLGFQPIVPMPWVPTAPGISGLPEGYTQETLAHYLMTGVRPNNLPPTLPPMPPYRMSEHDALAVAAYLASISK